ncbi:MAG: hypothetical protein ACR2RV_23845, partial [Verrucomicrobiales bacterium]
MAEKSDQKLVPAGLPLWKKLLFAGITGLLFFGLLELVLAVFGVKPLLFEDDPYVGFESKIPLFVESDQHFETAQNKTKWFNEQRFARRKPEGTRRIFCMGGSTTYGRPYRDATSFCGWLREFLPVADPTQGWELINAGGISYASYRIAALMEELVEYDPDLFIIYCGHNEFLERRTYGEMIDMPATVRGLQASLARSRTYSFISRAVMGGGVPPGAQTKLDAEVNTILDNTVGLEAYKRDEEWEQQVLAHYRFNLARMVDIARAGGAQVVFVTPAGNVRSSSPFKSESSLRLSVAQHKEWEKQFAEAERAHAAGDAAALAAIEAAVAIDPQHAHSQYLYGRILDGLGRFAEAKAAYELALENDVCPLRMLADMRQILAEVATDRDVPVVDFHQVMAGVAEHGMPGEAEFLDHVHPTIESHRLLALALVDELGAQGIAEVQPGWDEAAATARVMARVDDNERGIALRNLANVLQWAGKYEDAYVAAKKSLELTPGDAYANFVTGDLAQKLGKEDEAIKQYTFITGFSLNPADAPYYVEVHYKLAHLMSERGEYAESIRLLQKTLRLKPDHAGAGEALPLELQSWGTKLLQAGQGKQAVVPLQQLQELEPDDP